MGQRKSARAVIDQFADELMKRGTDAHVNEKLEVIATIAFRMGWRRLYDRIRFRKKTIQRDPSQAYAEPPGERWFQK